MKLPDWVWSGLAGLVAGALTTWLFCIDREHREAELDKVIRTQTALTTEHLRQDLAYALKTKGHVDSIFTVKYLPRWQTRDSLIHDTVYAKVGTDSTPIPVVPLWQVQRVIGLADSTINACQVSRFACESQVKLLTDLTRADSTQLRALSRELARKSIRNRISCTVGPAAALIGNDPKVAYIAIACGLRVF